MVETQTPSRMTQLNTKDVEHHWKDVSDDSSKTNWIVLTYAKQSLTDLVLQAKGDDFEDMLDELRDGKVQFLYINMKIALTEGTAPIQKLIFCFHVAEGLALGTKRATIMGHSQVLDDRIGAISVRLNTTKEEELSHAALLVRLRMLEQGQSNPFAGRADTDQSKPHNFTGI